MPVLVLKDNQILDEITKKIRETVEEGKQLDVDGIASLRRLLSTKMRNEFDDLLRQMKNQT